MPNHLPNVILEEIASPANALRYRESLITLLKMVELDKCDPTRISHVKNLYDLLGKLDALSGKSLLKNS